MNLLEVKFDINNNFVLCFLYQEIVYFPKNNSELVKAIIIIDPENQIKHQWLFFQKQILKKYTKYSLKQQKVISEKIYYASGQMKRYTEYKVVNSGFFYTENYDLDAFLNKKIGERHVEK